MNTSHAYLGTERPIVAIRAWKHDLEARGLNVEDMECRAQETIDLCEGMPHAEYVQSLALAGIKYLLCFARNAAAALLKEEEGNTMQADFYAATAMTAKHTAYIYLNTIKAHLQSASPSR
jgi:hypothetical protein